MEARAPGRSMIAPLAISLVAHAIVFVLAFAGGIPWPSPPIPIEVVPRTVRPPPPPPPPPAPRPVEKPKRATGPGPRAAAPPTAALAPSPAPIAPPETANLAPFAPADANLVLLVRSDTLRASPHKAAIEFLLSALPDYDTLLGGTGLLPIEDLEALLIATANPRSVSATFLAARYKDSERLRAIATRALHPGDPRMFRTLEPGLTVLTQPEGAARLDAALQKKSVSDGGDDPRMRWLEQLAQFDKAAQASNAPALLVTLSDAPALLRFGGGLPTPLAIALATTADASPALRLKLAFADESQAAQMAAAWPDILRRWRNGTMLMGLSAALDGLTLHQRGVEVELEGRIPETQLRIALELARALLPRRSVDGGAPPR